MLDGMQHPQTAAWFAAESGAADVTVLERTREAGKKILMSGGSRWYGALSCIHTLRVADFLKPQLQDIWIQEPVYKNCTVNTLIVLKHSSEIGQFQ